MFTKGLKSKKVYWKCSGEPFSMYMVGRVLVNVDASFIKNQFCNAGEVGSGTEQISLKATPPSYWDPAWNMQVIRRGDSEVVPLLVPEQEDINVGGIPEFDVEPFTVTVMKLVKHQLFFCDEEGEAGYVQLSRMAFGEEEALWDRQKSATAVKAAARVAKSGASNA